MTTDFSDRPPLEEPSPAAAAGHGRALGWVSFATAAKVGYGLAVLAVAAREFGLDAIGDLGQVLTVLALLTHVSTFGLGRGVTARHAMNIGDRSQLQSTNAAVAAIAVVGFAVSALLIGGAQATSLYGSFFSSDELVFTSWLLIAQVPLTAMGAILQSIAAAHGDAEEASQAAIVSYVVGLLVLFILREASLEVYVTAVLLQSGLTMLLIAARLRPRMSSDYGLVPRRVYSLVVHHFAEIAVEARLIAKFAIAIAIPLVFNLVARIVTRVLIRNELDTTALGQWEAITRMQDGYLQFLGAALALVLMPSIIRAPHRAAALQGKYIAGFACLCAVGAGIAVIAGSTVLRLTFGNSASGAGDLLALAFLMDLARSPFLVLQYGNLAASRVTRFLFLELLASMGLLGAVVTGLELTPASLESVFLASIAVCAGISLVAARGRLRDHRS